MLRSGIRRVQLDVRAEVTALEQALGIRDLARFTPA
jgi:hypothetical protein